MVASVSAISIREVSGYFDDCVRGRVHGKVIYLTDQGCG